MQSTLMLEAEFNGYTDEALRDMERTLIDDIRNKRDTVQLTRRELVILHRIMSRRGLL